MSEQRNLIEQTVRETLAAVIDCPDFIERREWFTPAEAGDYLSLSAKTLENLRLQGGGPSFSRLGYRIVRYRRADLDAWLEAGRQG